MTINSDGDYMKRALELAARGLYTCDPNPRVGCVLVNDDKIVGEGWHEKIGGPHAERVALEMAGNQAHGATVYVNLEPCSHTGRTGPCSDALIEAGVARVVFAIEDPNQVSGSGRSTLEDAGIVVETGLMEDAAIELNPGYLTRITKGRPFIRSKLAVSLDGHTALASGESQWITGDPARADVHNWRGRSSAVVTGVGTVLEDDPSLDARLEDSAFSMMQPKRIILDSDLRTPPTARTLKVPGDVIIFTLRDDTTICQALEERGARIEKVGGDPHCDLVQVFSRLAELEINEVWVEAGPALNGALIAASLIDELVIYMAPHVLGDTARGMFSIAPLENLGGCHMLYYRDVRRVGKDLRIIARPDTVISP
jgi:diaminohydroxyphosphoribosylaminopyrimidine deaminase/5-amino-6-(5-phosphoribosylamino)uracil reductase